MRIGIIGGGSIGLLFAYYMSQRFSVTLYTRTSAQAKKINDEGLILKDANERLHKAEITAVPVDEWRGSEDLTIVTVKQYQLPKVIDKIGQLVNKQNKLLFLQNGMGHLRLLQTLSGFEIYVGSVEHGANREGANLVKQNGHGVTKVAVFNGELSFLNKFVASIDAGFPFVIETSYDEMLVKKLVVNAVINPMTAVLKVENGALIENPNYYEVLKKLFAEVSAILRLNNQEEYFRHIVHVCRNTAKNRSSMLKDIERKSQTEVDAILGFLLDEAKEKRIQAPLVSLFFHIIKGLEFSWGDK